MSRQIQEMLSQWHSVTALMAFCILVSSQIIHFLRTRAHPVMLKQVWMGTRMLEAGSLGTQQEEDG